MTQYVQAKIETLEQPKMAWFLLSVTFLLIFAYVYFVNGAISYIVKAEDDQMLVAEIASSVGSLETEYLSAKSAVDMSYAESLGFSQAKSGVTYISKKSSAALSFNK